MIRSSQYKQFKPLPVPQVGMGCGCNQYGEGIFEDVWGGIKSVGSGLKSLGLAPSKLLDMASAPLAAVNPAAGGAAFAAGQFLKQRGYGKKKRKNKTKPKTVKRKPKKK